MRFTGALAGLCLDRMLWRRCGIRGPLGNYEGTVARAERKEDSVSFGMGVPRTDPCVATNGPVPRLPLDQDQPVDV